MEGYDDRKLVSLLCDDPAKGLSALLDAYGGLIHAIVNRVLSRTPQDVEECVSDVLIATWKNAEMLRKERRSLKGWLCVTSRNTALDRWRQLQRTRTVELDDEIMADLACDPCFQEAESDSVCSLISTLSQPDREIFIRKYYLFQSAAQIGAELGLAENTVNARLSRGRARMRQQIQSGQSTGVVRRARSDGDRQPTKRNRTASGSQPAPTTRLERTDFRGLDEIGLDHA